MASRVEVSSTLIWAIRAISLSHLGRQMQDRNLIQNSRNMYGKALLKLNQSLQDPVEGLHSDTLSATILLSFYEMMACTEQNSWVRHAGGAGNLMRLRGPDRHRSGYDSTIFLACRYTIIVEAFQTKKSCFLAEPAWRQLSWELRERSELQSPFYAACEEVFHVSAEFPGYVAEALKCMTGSPSDVTLLRDLISQGHHHRACHKRVQARMAESLKEAGQEPFLAPSAKEDTVFPMVYQFPSNLVGSHYCSFWSLMIVFNMVLIRLEAKLSNFSTPQPVSHHSSPQTPSIDSRGSPSAPLHGNNKSPLGSLIEQGRRTASSLDTTVTPTIISADSPSAYPTMSESDTAARRQLYMTESIECARQTCRSVESMCLSMFLGPLFLVFALRMALRVFSGEAEMEWTLEKLNGIGKTFAIAKIEVEVFREGGKR